MSIETWWVEQDTDDRWIQQQMMEFEQQQWEAMEDAKRLAAGEWVQLEFDFEFSPITRPGSLCHFA